MTPNSNDNIISPNNTNVILIEPNMVNINTTPIDGVPFVNGIPQYQDMYIFAELTARSKGRSVSVDGKWTGSNPNSINLMGNNQNNNGDPNYLNFTTNYYDGSTGNNIKYEGFGINSIKIKISASFVPQISIQFIDVRGLAFFNQNDSPYRMLFDFPPPTFTLTIKGYYGKSITYQIHLVKYTSEFSAENGNFIIDAQFVAMTFAPLSDILFRYVVNVALMDDAATISPDSSGKPTSTSELILKLKNLYSAIADKLDTDIDNKNFNNALKELENIDSAVTMLNEFPLNENLNLDKPLLIIKSGRRENYVEVVTATQENTKSEVVSINSFSDYDAVIKSRKTTGTGSRIDDRLYIAFIAGTNNTPDDVSQWNTESTENFIEGTNIPQITFPPYQGDELRISDLKRKLNEYRKTLIKNVNSSLGITESDIREATAFFNDINVANNTTQNTLTQYIVLDVTDYYTKLSRKRLDADKKKTELSTIVTSKINNMVLQGLGMTPSIYNIFEIILNDVDEFFTILRKTSQDAEIAHEKDYAKITGNNSDVNGNKIYAFPLIIDSSNVYGGSKQERVAPISLRNSGIDFPELKMVDDFINSFQTQKNLNILFNTKNEVNDDGTYKWIPISPIDSTLGGSSPESPYLGINDDVLPQLLQILLKRFYILTQGILYTDFYTVNPKDSAHNAYLKLFAEAEAINLASAFSTTKNSSNSNNMMKELANKYSKNPELFYLDAQKYVSTTYNFPSDSITNFPITPSNTTDGLVYVDKRNVNFQGMSLYEGNIEIQKSLNVGESEKNSSNPVDKFASNAKVKFFEYGFFKKGSPAEAFYEITNENVFYIKDNKGFGDSKDDISSISRFLCKKNTYNDGVYYFPNSLKNSYLFGNKSFQLPPENDKNLLAKFGSILDIWVTELSNNDDKIYDSIIKSGSTLGALILLSSFGNALSVFNKYPRNLNSIVFNSPAAIDTPTFLPLYIGALVDAVRNGWENQILRFFTGTTGVMGIGSMFMNNGFFILADLHDVKNYLSIKDSDIFQTEFNTYYSRQDGGYQTALKKLNDLYNDVKNELEKDVNDKTKIFGTKYDLYEFFLDFNSVSDNSAAGRHYNLLGDLMVSKNIINFSQITFQTSEMNTYSVGYDSLETINQDQNKKNINNKFFQILFGRLYNEIDTVEVKQKEDAEALKKVKGDKDIINQTYYSFKNINDKWVSGIDTKKGYPFNKPNKKLIDSFAFVDRAMNPIGDTIINAEILVEMLEDPNISVFTALSQLLSLNGFEFFPLQNFMNVGNNASWNDCFKIQTGAISATTSTAFVCMYIGGSSSYPSTPQNGFVNDGIDDLANPGVTDFSTPPVYDNNGNLSSPKGGVNDLQLNNNKDFPWQQVRAFRVRFGMQNQSMFTGIKIDSKEYPETNESIQILSRLAGDNKEQAPTPKGQNLYNLYENRSYKATITGLGNAMIQPTQYFQLENIPLFNGAYIILDVEHTIEANKMTTSFSGTKLLKYPVPRVLNPSAFTGFNDDTSSMSVGEITKAALISNDNRTKYNAMYSLKIE